MSVLVSLGILTSYLFSLGLTLFAPGQETFYEAAVMLAVFLLFGHWMEMKARRGSSDSVRKLLDLAPQRATRRARRPTRSSCRSPRSSSATSSCSSRATRCRSTARCIDGRSTIDESMVTGESIPVEKGPGDEVIAGHDQPGGLAALPRDQGRRRHRARPDRQAGRDGPEQQGAGPAAGRPGGALPGAGGGRLGRC